jgi:hypothetical protein
VRSKQILSNTSITGSRRTPRAHVFCGPTISAAEVRKVLPCATTHPPIASGDLGRIHWDPGDIAVIIDGMFQEVPAIRHKEIITVLQEGIHVCGASSMGALRAAELGDYGMVGVGIIYRLYSLGVLSRDDEVAVAHQPAHDGAAALSVALVTVRYAARRAMRKGLISAADEAYIVQATSDIPYFARRWKTIVRMAGLAGADAGRCRSFLDYCQRVKPDLKHEDALRLLHYVADERIKWPSPKLASVVPLTHFQQIWALDSRSESRAGELVSDLAALRCLQLVSPDFPSFYRRLCLQLIAAYHLGSGPRALDNVTNSEIERLALEAAGHTGAGRLWPARVWASFGLSGDPEARAQSRADVLTLLVRSYRHEPGVVPLAHAVERLKTLPAYDAARVIVVRAHRALERFSAVNSDFRADHVSPYAVAQYLGEVWPGGFARGAGQDRGFPSLSAASKAARPLVPYLLTEQVPTDRLRLMGGLPAAWSPKGGKVRDARALPDETTRSTSAGVVYGS